jgi:peptidase E
MQCYLYSSPPEPFPAAFAELVRRLVEEHPNPLVAYLPAGNIRRHFVRELKGFLRGVAEVGTIKPEVHSLSRVLAILDRAAMLFIPGGNTYLMAHRLHQLGLVSELRQRVLSGLPLVAFSAGTVLCGQDILTTNDINCCDCTQFDGLKLSPFCFNVHYPVSHVEAQQERDERLEEYLAFHDTPILALEDGAYLHLTEDELRVDGNVWQFSHGQKARMRLEAG